jgi:biopolymer transport protein ExbD
VSPGRDDERLFDEINITPLVDVFLVLLVISLVTGAALAARRVPVELPRTSATGGGLLDGSSVVISLDARGRLAVDGVPVTTAESALEAAVRRAIAAKRAREVVVAGDRGAALGRVVSILEVARRAGAERVSIAASTAERGTP